MDQTDVGNFRIFGGETCSICVLPVIELVLRLFHASLETETKRWLKTWITNLEFVFIHYPPAAVCLKFLNVNINAWYKNKRLEPPWSSGEMSACRASQDERYPLHNLNRNSFQLWSCSFWANLWVKLRCIQMNSLKTQTGWPETTPAFSEAEGKLTVHFTCNCTAKLRYRTVF